jgi:hypothetical protein
MQTQLKSFPSVTAQEEDEQKQKTYQRPCFGRQLWSPHLNILWVQVRLAQSFTLIANPTDLHKGEKKVNKDLNRLWCCGILPFGSGLGDASSLQVDISPPLHRSL